MKIAIPKDNENIFQHFGHTEVFAIYTVNDKAIESIEDVPVEGSGHGALADFLQHLGVSTLICGGIGAGAQEALTKANIKFFGGVQGSAKEAVNHFLNGTLEYNPDVKCTHHDHGHDHENGHCHGHE